MDSIRVSWIVVLLCIGMACVLTRPAHAQVCYTYKTFDIPTPSGQAGQTSFEGVNHGGVILGQYANQEPPDGYRVTRKANGSLVVSPYSPIAGHVSWPRGINAYRDTVGQVGVVAQPGVFTGYVRKATGGVEILQVPGSVQAEALGVNRKRDVVGWFAAADGIVRGFWRYKGTYLVLEAPGATWITTLTGINLAQDITGWYMDAEGRIHGLHLVDGIPTTLDVPGAENTFVLDLNDAGAMVGLHAPSDAFGQGFLYQDGAFYPITPGVGEMHSEATGITNGGEIVGNYLAADGLIRGFVATPQPACTTAPALVALAE